MEKTDYGACRGLLEDFFVHRRIGAGTCAVRVLRILFKVEAERLYKEKDPPSDGGPSSGCCGRKDDSCC